VASAQGTLVSIEIRAAVCVAKLMAVGVSFLF